MLLDGKEIGRHELFAVNPTPKAHRWGIHKLAASEHVLRFECVGKPDKSKGYLLGFDALTARVPVYARPAGFDLRKIQQPAPQASGFVRPCQHGQGARLDVDGQANCRPAFRKMRKAGALKKP